MYKDNSSFPVFPKQFETKIEVQNWDCLDAAQNLINEGFHPAVLNMANATSPGFFFLLNEFDF